MQDSQSFAMGLFSGEARTEEVFPYPEGIFFTIIYETESHIKALCYLVG